MSRLCRIPRALSLGLFVWAGAGAAFGAATAKPACDKEALLETRATFKQLQSLRRSDAQSVPDAEFRDVSDQYVRLAEACYLAQFGTDSISGAIIDEGGLWMGAGPGAAPTRFQRTAPGPSPRDHVLFGTKWGAGSPFAAGTDTTGPRLPGGSVTYSFMATGVDLSAESAGTATAITGVPGYDPCWVEQITDAFGAWSAVANISFAAVSDNGAPFDSPGASGDIRIGFHAFDGPTGVLAHTYFPPPNGTSAAGDLHFDVAEGWACDPASGIDIGIVALHEIGHGIGLGHEASDPAVMNAFYNRALNFGPLADDIIGAGNIYGGSPTGKSYFFGNVGIGTDSPAESLHIRRDDGTARLLVEETSPVALQRSVFRLRNRGGIRFDFEDTSGGAVWQFLNSGGLFRIINPKSPGLEFQLTPAGNLTIEGSLTTAASFVPDYVFDEGYRLMPLNELAEFVRTAKHLPKIASAQDIKADGGVNVSEMQMRLLEKIEELTLYTIQQQERLDALEQRLDLLERDNAALRKLADPGKP